MPNPLLTKLLFHNIRHLANWVTQIPLKLFRTPPSLIPSFLSLTYILPYVHESWGQSSSYNFFLLLTCMRVRGNNHHIYNFFRYDGNLHDKLTFQSLTGTVQLWNNSSSLNSSSYQTIPVPGIIQLPWPNLVFIQRDKFYFPFKLNGKGAIMITIFILF